MIYICPQGLLHDVISALMSHFIVVVSDELQIFARCVHKTLEPFDERRTKDTEVVLEHIKRSSSMESSL